MISADGYVGLVNAKTMSEIRQPLSTYLPTGYFVHEYEQRFLRVLPEDRDRDVALRARAIEIVVEEGQDHVVTMRMVSGESPKSTATR